MWRLCRGQESLAAAEEAVALLEPLGPSAELAWALVNLASQRMMSEHQAAIGLARRAAAIAESLGVPEVLSEALNTEGCALAGLGEDWTGPLERALAIAVAEGLQGQAGRAFANIHSMYCGQLRFTDAEPYFADGMAYCDEHDIGTFGICLRGEHTGTLEMLGRWDESAALSLELLTRSGASPVNRINPLTSLGKILARRGEPGAWEQPRRGDEVRGRAGEPPRSCGSGWPGPKRPGSKGGPPTRGAKPSWPMTRPRVPTAGSAA